MFLLWMLNWCRSTPRPCTCICGLECCECVLHIHIHAHMCGLWSISLCVAVFNHPIYAQSMLEKVGIRVSENFLCRRHKMCLYVCLCVSVLFEWLVCVLGCWCCVEDVSYVLCPPILVCVSPRQASVFVSRSWGAHKEWRGTMIYVGFTEYLWTENGAHHLPPHISPFSISADMRETLRIGKLIHRQVNTFSKFAVNVSYFVQRCCSTLRSDGAVRYLSWTASRTPREYLC